ncbi:MAG: CoA ester lyase [Rhodobacteraceae bacterium]|nr:CoA ester lyase [Paracoccaceae bacterium]
MSNAPAFEPEATAHRPRRSVLYMPGSKLRALEKAKTLSADCLILDLEDAVAPSEKEAARGMIAEALKQGGYGQRELIVRVNGLDTPWGEADLKTMAVAGADAILIPKVNAAPQIEEIEGLINRWGATSATRLWAMIETPRGMLHVESIAASTPRLDALVMGTNDLANELGAAHTELRLPMITGLGLCMLAARAYGLAILDGVYNAFKDEDGLRAACQQSKEMGFDGRTLIHPAQLEIANEVFAPSAEELDLAQKQVAAYEDSISKGEAVAVVEGKIVENLHVETAKKLLAQAKAISDMAGA